MTDGGVNEAWTYASIFGHFVGGRFNHLICGNLSQVRGRINTHTQVTDFLMVTLSRVSRPKVHLFKYECSKESDEGVRMSW